MALAGCGVRVTAAAAPGRPTTASRTRPSTTSRPRRAHLVVVIEENHSFEPGHRLANASRINQLAASGVSLTNFYATTHPSLPNYIALTSGDTQGINSDCGQCDVNAPNLIDQLEAAKVSWHVYAQGFPGSCSRSAGAGAYAKKHVPFLYYRVGVRPARRCATRSWRSTGSRPTPRTARSRR